MLFIFQADGTTRIAVAYNGLSINTLTTIETDPTGYPLDAVGFQTGYDYISENFQWMDGIELYGMHAVSRILDLRGRALAATQAAYADAVKTLADAFDPSKIMFKNPTDPFLPLTFSVPTADTATYPTGYATSKYLALPIRMPEPPTAYDSTTGQPFRISMLLQQPKRFLQTAQTQAGSATVANSKADTTSWPVLTITMAGAGSATYTAQNTATTQGAKSIVLNLSGAVNTDVYVVDFFHRKITKNGVVTPSVFVSGSYWMMEPGNNVILYSNTTNATSSLTHYPAFSF